MACSGYPNSLSTLEQRMRRETFDWIWEDMSEDGSCDDVFGAEYLRVLTAWEQAGSPAIGISAFIQREANRGAGNTATQDDSER